MKVDYANVADRYDKNLIRHGIDRDPVIDTLAGVPRVLDLGCGTGLYLVAQRRHFALRSVEWHGLDPSEAMLRVAAGKGLDARFMLGCAENLPFPAAHFDYVVTRFTFHHFGDKRAALDEIARVLRPGGVLKIENFAPELSPDWWIFRYFPAAVGIDRRRFWPITGIDRELRARGFAVTVETRAAGLLPIDKILTEARNRDASQLILLDDAAYASGLAALERDIEAQKPTSLESGMTLINITGRHGDIALGDEIFELHKFIE